MAKEKMMDIRGKLLICGTVLLAQASPIAAQAPTAAKVTAVESVQPNSSVSMAVEPTLSDGRLIVKMAIQNRGSAPLPFGPGNVSITKLNGEPIVLVPLQKLVDDVRVASGEPPQVGLGSHAGGSAYAAPVMPINSEGQVDVSGYTGGMGISGDETLRRSRPDRTKRKATISPHEADQQIQALKTAILQDLSLQPKQIAAGQLVSEPLKFKTGEDRTLHLRVRVAGDEHGFTIMAPNK